MENQIIIEVRAGHLVALIADLVQLDRTTIQIKDTGNTLSTDASLDDKIIEVIVASVVSGAVSPIASSITARLAKILSKAAKRGICLVRARYGKRSVELEAKSEKEIEESILTLGENPRTKQKI